jgi:hypothetical protein
MSSLTFPHALRLAASDGSRPMIRFECLGDGGTGAVSPIYLPAPEGIQFRDSATYDDTELGFRGAQIANAARSLSGNGGSMLDGLKNMIGSIPTNMRGIIGAASNILPMDDTTRSAIGIGTGTTLNKNITTEFTQVGTRTFTFEFLLVPTSESEATTIKNIVKTFRENLYPSGTDYQLRYPPKWKVQFVTNPNGSSDNSYLPKIYKETFLTDFESSYNSLGNIWRTNAAPLDTTISVTFRETKALTKEDIQSL